MLANTVIKTTLMTYLLYILRSSALFFLLVCIIGLVLTKVKL